MDKPIVSRPHMPGYGVVGPEEGTGLLPWAWAEQRLAGSHEYWLATVRPDGRPHVMPVWGVWNEGALWFSSGLRSRKARNLAADSRCVLTTDTPREPVVIEGRAELVVDLSTIAAFAQSVNVKYETDYQADFYDPAVNGCFRVRPSWAFGIAEADFTGSATRWVFPDESNPNPRGTF
jgi:PPOX class probable F420-dependent enzyme